MQTLETMKARSQERFTNLVEKAKEQPDDVKTWGMMAGGALVGAAAVAVTANGIVAILTALAAPPVALTVGAIGGGLLGWNYMRSHQAAGHPVAPPAAPVTDTAPVITEAILVETAVAADTSADSTVSSTEQPGETLPTLPIEPTDVTDFIMQDNLEAINGIGPVYASRLQAAGIQTFAQLAELTPEDIRKIIGPVRSEHLIEVEKWIAEARQFAEHAM